MVGRTLSHYKILQKLGSGGMGEVYVAEDTKLSRHVALKVLSPQMATGERLMRFEREAKAVAALNHPNIVTIYSVEESEGVHFITMELVKGKTVTEQISKKGLPLNTFFEIAIPLADAVSAAHEKGIIHRDLKPDNLMVSDEGGLKILDFGLAKLKQEFAQEGISELPTQSPTQEGRILGTVAYMSPEQAEGKSVDHRSDIFSVGIILYEMATGERPFKGETTVSILSSIVKDTPTSVTEVNPDRPRILSRIIKRCLAKDPTRRYQTALDLRNELEELKQEVESGEVVEGFATAAPYRRTKRIWLLAAAAVTIAVLATVAVTYLLLRPQWQASEGETAPAVGTFTQLTSLPGLELFPSLSPDGDNLVYCSQAAGNWDIYLKRVGGERVMNLTENSPADDRMPALSPDGGQIAFRSERDGGGIFLMGATGESVRRLTDFGFNPAWSPDGKEIVFATENRTDPISASTISQLWTIEVPTGEKRLVSEGDAVHPTWSPRKSRIAYCALTADTGQRDILTISSSGGEAVPVTDDAYVDWNPVWSPDGKYIYFSSDRSGSMNLWRIPIEEESGKLLGPPEAVTTGATGFRQHISFSKDGSRIAYVEGVLAGNIWKVAFDPEAGTVEGKSVAITEGSRQLTVDMPSPDGQWLLYTTRQQEDIFIVRADGTDPRQLTDDLHKDRRPRWSPDGDKISFYSDRSGSYEIWTIHPDGSGLQQLTDIPGQVIDYHDWSPDGLRMVYDNWTEGTTHIFDPNKPWKEQVPLTLPPMSEGPERFYVESWSPDGRWLAGYALPTDGPSKGIVIYSLESQEYRRLTDFGRRPRWLADSRRLLFRDSIESGEIFLLDIESGRVQEILSVSPDYAGEHSVSPDNRWIYFSRWTYEADIWMLTLDEEPK